ncbi:hypothetical protein GGR55DRAFT_681620 [Xylaria sp. FL0064]|nr:hypothetical protein GGR55DRAFT_681620 [Xylaria sp. FL0064]
MAQVNNGAQEVTNVVQDLDIGRYLEIRFHSSVRVRDHGDRPLQPVAKESLHSESPFVLTRHNEGGQSTYLLPMRVMGALAIYMGVHRGSLQAFKVCVKVGTVNVAAPGQYGFEQCYFVAPGQEWIDGVANSKNPHRVRQFVALDPGTDHSFEHQITEEDENGGIEIQISLGTPVHRVGRQSEMGFSIIVRHWTPNKSFSLHNVLPEDTVLDLKRDIFTQLGLLPERQQLRWNGKGLEDERLLGAYPIKKDDGIQLLLRLRGGDKHAIDEEMQIAPGGLIQQSIFKDPGWYQWDDEPIGTLKIEVVDDESFQRLTGSPPPAPPPLPGARIQYIDRNVQGDNILKSLAEAEKLNPSTRPIGRTDPRRFGSSDDPRSTFSQRFRDWIGVGRGQRRAEDVV